VKKVHAIATFKIHGDDEIMIFRSLCGRKDLYMGMTEKEIEVTCNRCLLVINKVRELSQRIDYGEEIYV
jgi:hypothetical protein